MSGTRYNPTSITTGHETATQINTERTAVETAIDDTLSRSGKTPNSMSANFDMNSNRVLNLPSAVSGSEPATKAQLDAASTATTFDPTISNFLQSGTGAVSRTIDSKLGDWVSAADFGAVGDDSTDVVTELNAGILAVSQGGGGTLLLPDANYITSGDLIMKKGVKIIGVSPFGTTIKKSGANSRTFLFDDATIDMAEISDVRLTPQSGTPTAGFAIEFNTVGALGNKINRVLMEDVYAAIGGTTTTLGVNDIQISECELLRCINKGIYIQTGINWMVDRTVCTMADGSAGTIALWFDTATEGCLITDSFFLGGEFCGRFTDSLALGGPKENRFNSVIFDGGSVSTAGIFDSASKRQIFNSCWISGQKTGAKGIVIDNEAVLGFNWNNGTILNMDQHAIEVTAAKSFHIAGGRIANWGRAAAATYSGVNITDGNTGNDMVFSVRDVHFATDADMSGSNAWNGVNVNTDTYDKYIVTNNMSSGLTGTFVTDSGTATTAKVVANNI